MVDGIGKEGSGQPIEFEYIHINEANNLSKNDNSFNQQREPVGQFVRENNSGFKTEGPFITGVKQFEAPLIVDFGGDYQSGENWKDKLSEAFDGKSGKGLTSAIKDAGYDSIITIDEDGDFSEMVDLTVGKGGRPLLLDDHWILTDRSSDAAVARMGSEKGNDKFNGVSRLDGEYGANRYLLKQDGLTVAGAQVLDGKILDMYKDINSSMNGAEKVLMDSIKKDFGSVGVSLYASDTVTKTVDSYNENINVTRDLSMGP